MPYIIAEIGFNHEGDIKVAKQMIAAAADAGANAVKFQTYRAEDLSFPSSPHFKVIKCGQMNLKQHLELAGVAKANKVDFISTTYSLWAVDLLENVGVKSYKIASMDLTNTELLRCVAKTAKPLIISTGMAKLSEIVSTVKMLRKLKSGTVTLLHCLSQYPVNQKDINLAFMDIIRKASGCPVGYSDHAKGTFACLIAAILGAEVIEKHFTLDNSKEGGDHCHSVDPAGLKKLIGDINTALSIIGDGASFVNRADRKYAKQYRRGVYSRVEIPKATKILREYLLCCRPQANFVPDDLDKIVGRVSRRQIRANSPIRRGDL